MKRRIKQSQSSIDETLKLLRHLLTLTVLAGLSGIAHSADSLAGEQLKELNEQIEFQTDSIKQQKTSIKTMEQRLECTYSLLQSYNLCEEENEKNSDRYISCMGNAKAQNTTCLGNGS